MRYHAADEIGADAFDAQIRAQEETGLECRLDLETIEELVEFVSSRYAKRVEFEGLLDLALRTFAIVDEPDRTGYKCVLGKIIARRRAYHWRFLDQLVKHAEKTAHV